MRRNACFTGFGVPDNFMYFATVESRPRKSGAFFSFESISFLLYLNSRMQSPFCCSDERIIGENRNTCQEQGTVRRLSKSFCETKSAGTNPPREIPLRRYAAQNQLLIVFQAPLKMFMAAVRASFPVYCSVTGATRSVKVSIPFTTLRRIAFSFHIFQGS